MIMVKTFIEPRIEKYAVFYNGLDTVFPFVRMIARVGRHALTRLELTLPALLFYKKAMEKKNFSEIEIKKRVSLKKYNTMEIDCLAEFLKEAKNKEDIEKAIKFAKEKNLSFFILGKGSNVILPLHYKGVVIFIAMDDFHLQEEGEKVMVDVQAGAYLPTLAEAITKAGGKGMEWAGGVPGTLGGAVRGNAGAFGDFIADFVKEVEALHINTYKREVFLKKDCHFAYRNSIFKKKEEWVVLGAKMEFQKEEGGRERFKEYLEYRQKNHPVEPSSGSIFKNPTPGEEFFVNHPEMEKFRELGFVPARVLIAECGLSGERKGEAKISEKHPNFIVNTGAATGDDVQALIHLAQEKVKKRFALEMEEEVVKL